MATKCMTTQRRLWLLGVAFACFAALLCSTAPPKAHAGVVPTGPGYRVYYDFMNGESQESTVASDTPLFLPIQNPTWSGKFFLGYRALSANGNYADFGWDWLHEGLPVISGAENPSNIPPTFLPTFFEVTADTTVTAQWSTITKATRGTVYQDMLSEESPLWEGYPTKVYSVDLEANKTYHFQTWLPGGDSYLNLYDSSLDYIDSDDDDCPDWTKGAYGYGYLTHYGSHIEFTPEESGRYYVLASTYGDDTNHDDQGMSFFRYDYKRLAEPRARITWISQGKAVGHTYFAPGQHVTAFAAPSRKGYTFKGWYRNAAFTNKMDFSDYHMPTADINIFAKMTSNDSHVKGIKKSAGTLTQKWTTSNIYNTLKLKSDTAKVTIKPVRCRAQSVIYMKYAGGTYKKVNSMTVSVKKGQKKAIYIKCVSETGSAYKTTYKLNIKRSW